MENISLLKHRIVKKIEHRPPLNSWFLTLHTDVHRHSHTHSPVLTAYISSTVMQNPLELLICLHLRSTSPVCCKFRAIVGPWLMEWAQPLSWIVAVFEGCNPVLECVCAVKLAGPTQHKRGHHQDHDDGYLHSRLS